jgi:[ribosomal protein S5]-alanine N-acetyltransferase
LEIVVESPDPMPSVSRGNLARLETGERVYLRQPLGSDAQEFLALVRASRSYHRPWVHPPTTAAAFRKYAAKVGSERLFPCFIFLRETDELVGVVNLSEIVRGLFQSAYVGFYGHAAHAGQGLMREGMQLLLRHAFRRLKLHRIEANVQPGNTRSLALIRALGFRKEGLSPRYLKIGGRWRDHERWALLAEDWKGRRGE